MPQFKITTKSVKVTDDGGLTLKIKSGSSQYREACNAVLTCDWSAFIAYYKASQAEKNVKDEHDPTNWNGSPIYYLTREMANDQVSDSYGFWKFHDFGIAAPAGRRYSTVPTGVGPYAPDGYDWVCVPQEV